MKVEVDNLVCVYKPIPDGIEGASKGGFEGEARVIEVLAYTPDEQKFTCKVAFLNDIRQEHVERVVLSQDVIDRHDCIISCVHRDDPFFAAAKKIIAQFPARLQAFISSSFIEAEDCSDAELRAFFDVAMRNGLSFKDAVLWTSI